MDEDRRILVQEIDLKKVAKFAYFKSSQNFRSDIFAIDKYLKLEHYMLSASERELLKSEKTVIVGRKFIVNQEHGFVFIAPFIKVEKLSKEFKEQMRLLKIEPKLRGYLFQNRDALKVITQLLT